ncbi:MAG: glycosyltransferase [Armatimonadota bacterium]|nr:glycosyltransferase [Armatimonadota bacterium]
MRTAMLRKDDGRGSPTATVGARTRVLLMVDYFFPPAGGAAVHRTLGLASSLPDFGWEPLVLTSRAPEHVHHDVSLLRRVPATLRVERTPSLEPVRFVKRVLSRQGGEGSSGTRSSRGRQRRGRGARAISRVLQWMFFPDRHVGWLPFALARGLSLAKRQQFDAIYSTSTSVNSHLVARVLKRASGAFWVADFQDPWAHNEILGLPSWPHAVLAARLEHLILRDADRVTVTTGPIAAMLQRTYPAIPASKFAVLPMGFDPEAFGDLRGVAVAPTFTITHLGFFYGPRSPGPFLEALGRCVRDGLLPRDLVTVRLLGGFDADAEALTAKLVRAYALEGVVHTEGVVAYGEGLRRLVESAVLLLVTDDGWGGRTLVPTKLYEYLAAGRPILALAPAGPTADLIEETGAGIVVHPDDTAGICDALVRCYARWRDGVRSVAPRGIDRFTWREITREFVRLLEA